MPRRTGRRADSANHGTALRIQRLAVRARIAAQGRMELVVDLRAHKYRPRRRWKSQCRAAGRASLGPFEVAARVTSANMNAASDANPTSRKRSRVIIVPQRKISSVAPMWVLGSLCPERALRQRLGRGFGPPPTHREVP